MNAAKATVLDNASLVEKSVEGDPRAREELARACFPRVRRMVFLAYGNRPDVEDVIQMVLVTVFRDLHSLRKTDGFRAWLDRVTYNVVRSHGRRRTLLSLVLYTPNIDEVSSPSAACPERSTARNQLFERLSDHLDKISAKNRSALVMSMFFGHVDSEIGQIMNCSTETAKKRVQNGRRVLVQRLQADPQCQDLLKEVVKWQN